MKNIEKFKEIFGFDLNATCLCTSKECKSNCKKNPNMNVTGCPLWLNEEYKETKVQERMKLRTPEEQKAYLDGYEMCAKSIKQYLSGEGKEKLELLLAAVRAVVQSEDKE